MTGSPDGATVKCLFTVPANFIVSRLISVYSEPTPALQFSHCQPDTDRAAQRTAAISARRSVLRLATSPTPLMGVDLVDVLGQIEADGGNFHGRWLAWLVLAGSLGTLMPGAGANNLVCALCALRIPVSREWQELASRYSCCR